MGKDPDIPKGFAGFNDLVSEVEDVVPRDAPAVAPPGPSTGTGTSTPSGTSSRSGLPQSPAEVVKVEEPSAMPVYAYLVGFVAVISTAALLYGIAGNINDTRPALAESSGSATPTPVAEAPAPVARTYYKLKDGEGKFYELEGPPDATPEQLNTLARARWTPSEVYLPEEIPNAGNGLLLNDNQIRYCLSQKVRLGGWSPTVDSYDEAAVTAFNERVRDYNARCSHFRYHASSYSTVKSQVDARLDRLNEDGRAHRGPRPPPTPPTFTVVSSRVEGMGERVGQNTPLRPSARCAGSYEPEQCEAVEATLRGETPQQAVARRQALEQERQAKMSQVNEDTGCTPGEVGCVVATTAPSPSDVATEPVSEPPQSRVRTFEATPRSAEDCRAIFGSTVDEGYATAFEQCLFGNRFSLTRTPSSSTRLSADECRRALGANQSPEAFQQCVFQGLKGRPLVN